MPLVEVYVVENSNFTDSVVLYNFDSDQTLAALRNVILLNDNTVSPNFQFLARKSAKIPVMQENNAVVKNHLTKDSESDDLSYAIHVVNLRNPVIGTKDTGMSLSLRDY